MRRIKIKIVGIPEGEEKGRPTVATLIPMVLGKEHLRSSLVIDRAAKDGEKPRTLIAQVHLKEQILRLCQDRNLEYNGCKVLIFPHYTAEVMEQAGFQRCHAKTKRT